MRFTLGWAGLAAGRWEAGLELEELPCSPAAMTSASHPGRVSITQIVLTLRPYARVPPPQLAPLGGYIYIYFITHLVTDG